MSGVNPKPLLLVVTFAVKQLLVSQLTLYENGAFVKSGSDAWQVALEEHDQ